MEEGAQSLHDIEHSAYFRIRFDAVYALELCSRTPDRLWRASGAHALFEGSSIQQKFRDLHAVSQHGGADIASALSDYGKFLLDPEGFLAKYSPPGSEVTTAALFR